MKKLHIYHINDLHSHFDNWPKIRRFLLEKKAFHEKNGEEVLLFDIGDACDRVHPLTEATNGKANIELLNQVPFDAVTIGNNEGIGNDKRQLDELYDDAEFPGRFGEPLRSGNGGASVLGTAVSDQDIV